MNDHISTKEPRVKKILVVEDVELNIDLMVQILEEEYQVLVAKDGEEGVRAARHQHPDLVLMDISLPVMDGYEAARLIRAEFPRLPIIGLSAHAMQGDAQKAIAAGCNDYLTKPVNETLLLHMLRRLLGE